MWKEAEGLRCAAIAQAILETSTLEHVDLAAANDITLTGANAIFVAMLGNSSVNSLDLSSKPSCVRNRIVLKEMLIYNKSLKHLNVAGTSLGHEGLQVLARGLMGNTCLLTLDISQNSAGNKGASYIAEVLKVCALEELSMSENRIGKTMAVVNLR
ncbi:Leucine-rich repeat-containing protein LOC400891-like [Symbiodinium microadriaticum]|uniref:Leucine-rich repeat-containing protein LOC400891-like n=1 Tax=Symbiodinium microadriaticum TaxID=2951 RepID=A0A1Q9E4C5_SYMMI|nr:Leucine-rich repeat-containing protein LOC400891-like [Symbiodinium microadriaticum]